MRKKKDKPRYNMWQNSGFMIGMAWKYEKQTLSFALLEVIAVVGISLVNLYVAPTILNAVQKRVAIGEVLFTIITFTFLLILFNSLKAYVDQNVVYGRIGVRSALSGLLHDKICTTSYVNVQQLYRVRANLDNTSRTIAKCIGVFAVFTDVNSI